jgi:hypothetical protein
MRKAGSAPPQVHSGEAERASSRASEPERLAAARLEVETRLAAEHLATERLLAAEREAEARHAAEREAAARQAAERRAAERQQFAARAASHTHEAAARVETWGAYKPSRIPTSKQAKGRSRKSAGGGGSGEAAPHDNVEWKVGDKASLREPVAATSAGMCGLQAPATSFPRGNMGQLAETHGQHSHVTCLLCGAGGKLKPGVIASVIGVEPDRVRVQVQPSGTKWWFV